MPKTLILETAKKFDYKRTVWSHGWYQLLPFEFKEETWTLGAIINCPHPVFVEINGAENSLRIDVNEKLNNEQEAKIIS